jgi:hypothetical protein
MLAKAARRSAWRGDNDEQLRVRRERREWRERREIFRKTQVLLVYVRESKAAWRSRQRLVE